MSKTSTMPGVIAIAVAFAAGVTVAAVRRGPFHHHPGGRRGAAL